MNNPESAIDASAVVVPGDWRGFTLALFARMHRELHTMLHDTDIGDLRRRVRVDANPVGWLAWHLTRSHDRNMSEIAEIEQRWTANGWAQQFQRAADPNDTGYQHAAHDVDTFNPTDPQTILRYHADVMTTITRYLASASVDDLNRFTTSPTLGTTATVAQRLEGAINEGFQHLGQIAITLTP